jgi:hypothetical protein
MILIVKTDVVFEEQVFIILAVEYLAFDLGVELMQAFYLAILLSHQFLVHSGNLDEKIVLGEVKIGCELRRRPAAVVPGNIETYRLVEPFDIVEIEKAGKLLLAAMGEAYLVPSPVLPFIHLYVFYQPRS